MTDRIENGTAPKQILKTPAFGGLSSEKRTTVLKNENRNSPEPSHQPYQTHHKQTIRKGKDHDLHGTAIVKSGVQTTELPRRKDCWPASQQLQVHAVSLLLLVSAAARSTRSRPALHQTDFMGEMHGKMMENGW